jgi:hypothetical protein
MLCACVHSLLPSDNTWPEDTPCAALALAKLRVARLPIGVSSLALPLHLA